MEPIRKQQTHTTIQKQFMKDWELLICVEGKSTRNGKWQGIAFFGKNREGIYIFAGCQSTRNRDINVTKATSIREAVLTACILGFRKLIVLTSAKNMEYIWESNTHCSWHLKSIFEDLHYLQHNYNLQLQIQATPPIILQEASSKAAKASKFFVNVLRTNFKPPL